MTTTAHPPARFADPDGTLTEDAVVERAASLRGLLRGQQDEAEELGGYVPAVHDAMLEAGLYHLLTPRRYGGLEMSLRTFVRTVIEIGRGDPGSGWCYCLGHAHNQTTAAVWPQAAQDEVFDNPAGYFRAPHSLNPAGTARKVDGGYVLKGRSPYSSGGPYATHATVAVAVEGDLGPGGMPRFMQALIPMEACTVADDWGSGHVLGMRASGSHSVVFDDVLVPEHFLVDMTWIDASDPAHSGAAIHGNSMYAGVPLSFLNLELATCAVATARAAVDEYPELLKGKYTLLPPRTLKTEDPGHQRDLGEATIKTDAAEALVLHIADLAQEWSETRVRTGTGFTHQQDAALFGLGVQAGRLASEAVELLFRSAGSSAARPGQRMERYLRDIMMYQTHFAAQYEQWAQRFGALRLGVVDRVL